MLKAYPSPSVGVISGLYCVGLFTHDFWFYLGLQGVTRITLVSKADMDSTRVKRGLFWFAFLVIRRVGCPRPRTLVTSLEALSPRPKTPASFVFWVSIIKTTNAVLSASNPQAGSPKTITKD